MMKRTHALVLALAALTATLSGCAYNDVAVHGDKAVIVRNDFLLFGALRKVYVCQITDQGMTNCQHAESP